MLGVQHVKKWRECQVPNHVINWITSGISIPFVQNPPNCTLQNHKLSGKQKVFVNEEVSRLLSTKAIVKANELPKCIVPIGCVPKKGNKLRLIVDLRHVNTYCSPPKFRYEDVSLLPQVINHGDKLVTIDLKDGFHHIPISDSSAEFLGFQWNNVIYKWKVCPFGLSCSPYFFCKTLRPCIEFLRSKGIRLLCYMDDILVAANDADIDNHKDIVVETLQSWGWHINFEKSSLEPSECKEFLGFIVNSNGKNNLPELKVPNYKIKKLKKDIGRILVKDTIKARQLAQIIGRCNAMCKAIFPGRLMLREAYRLLSTKTSWDSILYLTGPVIKDLEWWRTALHSWNGAAIIASQVDFQVETDASSIGWGVSCGTLKAQGLWSKSMAYKSSNFRELFTVLMALKSFQKQFHGKTIQVLSDNITTVAYLNHMGGPYWDLTDLAKTIWTECFQNKVMIVSHHLKGSLNVRADHLSRIQNKFEWRLNPHLFNVLDKMWGPHSYDRFASLTNTHLALYNSRFHDPLTSGVDALAQNNWKIHNNYVNAPFRLIPEVLKVVSEQKATATIIAPWWPAQPWFRKLRHLSVSPPLKLPNTCRAFQAMNKDIIPEPLLNPRWKIYAWRVCGKQD